MHIIFRIQTVFSNQRLYIMVTNQRNVKIKRKQLKKKIKMKADFKGNDNYTHFKTVRTGGQTKNPFAVIKDKTFLGGARGVMVIVVGNGHGDTSSNPGRD